MKISTKKDIGIASALGRRGFTIASVQVQTLDGRRWIIDTTNAGGFRLFEIGQEGRDRPNEHDAVEGDTWTAAELIDYLGAVGKSKSPTPSPPAAHNLPSIHLTS